MVISLSADTVIDAEVQASHLAAQAMNINVRPTSSAEFPFYSLIREN